MSGIVVICTANQCRSPVAAALLTQRLSARGLDVEVRSAGFMEGGVQPPVEILRVAMMFGLDLSAHRSHQVDWAALRDAELIVTMERGHIREIAVHDPTLWPKTFAIRELVRRAHEVGGRANDVRLAEWISQVHTGRSPADLLGVDPSDEVEDPIGGPQGGYDKMAEILYGLTHELVELIWPRSFA